jgi:hypothetical protein
MACSLAREAKCTSQFLILFSEAVKSAGPVTIKKERSLCNDLSLKKFV